MKYEVTIGIPVYKSKDYIVKTMESALSQSFKSIEFLVVDDCGKDGSIEVIQRIQKEHPRGTDIHIFKNSRNYGVSFCRNFIIDNAQGKFLYFLDSDDTIEPFAIQLLYDSIIQNCVDVAYGSYDIINVDGQSSAEVYQKTAMLISEKDELAIYAFNESRVFHVSVCNCLMNLSFLRHTGVRFFDVLYWEDMVFTYEFVPYVKRAILLSDITYHYLHRDNSLSNYQEREIIEKEEIMNNVSTILFLKKKCQEYKGKKYLPYMCYNLEVNCFFIISYIVNNRRKIVPKISVKEMHNIISHPLPFKSILQFRKKLFSNLFFWLLGVIPGLLFFPIFMFLAKLKRTI